MNVELTPAEMLNAIIVGARRLIVSNEKGLQNVAGAKRDWSDEIEGALAEMAVARELGLFFSPNVGLYGLKDVGDYHIRHTALTDGSLIIRDKDPEGRYLLVTGQFGHYKLAGWIESDKAKEMDQYRKAPNGRSAAWLIPQTELMPV